MNKIKWNWNLISLGVIIAFGSIGYFSIKNHINDLNMNLSSNFASINSLNSKISNLESKLNEINTAQKWHSDITYSVVKTETGQNKIIAQFTLYDYDTSSNVSLAFNNTSSEYPLIIKPRSLGNGLFDAEIDISLINAPSELISVDDQSGMIYDPYVDLDGWDFKNNAFISVESDSNRKTSFPQPYYLEISNLIYPNITGGITIFSEGFNVYNFAQHSSNNPLYKLNSFKLQTFSNEDLVETFEIDPAKIYDNATRESHEFKTTKPYNKLYLLTTYENQYGKDIKYFKTLLAENPKF